MTSSMMFTIMSQIMPATIIATQIPMIELSTTLLSTVHQAHMLQRIMLSISTSTMTHIAMCISRTRLTSACSATTTSTYNTTTSFAAREEETMLRLQISTASNISPCQPSRNRTLSGMLSQLTPLLEDGFLSLPLCWKI